MPHPPHSTSNRHAPTLTTTPTPDTSAPSHGALVGKLLVTVGGMFCFAVFLLPPLYDVFCDITGLNGKYNDGRVSAIQPTPNPSERTVSVQFLADESTTIPWPFFPKTRSLIVNPGNVNHVLFRLENPNSTAIVAQAIPSISPAEASLYLKKTQCFCFNRQALAPFEGKDMGVSFYIDPNLPATINEITLSYRLYDITDQTTPTPESLSSPPENSQPTARRPAHTDAEGGIPNV